jgi:O-antigen/teichoic acid export membrane protein
MSLKFDIIYKKFNKIYKRIFNENLDLNTKKFFKNISYITSGTFIAVIISTIFNILIANLFGPLNYGILTLVQSVASFLQIPMILGITTATMRYNSIENKYSTNISILSTSLLLVTTFTIISTFFYFLFSKELSNFFSINIELFYFSIILAIFITIFSIFSSFLLSLNKIKKYSALLITCNSVMLVMIVLFIYFNMISFVPIIISFYIGYGLASIFIYIFFLRKYLQLIFSKKWAKVIIKYSNYSMIGAISFVIYNNIDKIFIAKYMNLIDLGIYKAYYTTSIGLIGLLTGVFTIIFLTASKNDDKSHIFMKINKSIPYLIIILLPAMIIVQFIILKLYGSNYPFNLSIAFVFAIGGVLVFIESVYAWLMNSVGYIGAKITSLAALVLAITNILFNYLFIPVLGINGAIFSIIISYTLATFVIISKRKYLYKK